MMAGVTFCSSNVNNFASARADAIKKLKNGIGKNDRIDIVRTEGGYKLSRQSIYFGKRGVTTAAKEFLNAVDLYPAKGARIGGGQSLTLLEREIGLASKMELAGVLWESRDEIYTPCGFIPRKAQWKVVEKIKGDGQLFVVLPAMGENEKRIHSILKSVVGKTASWRRRETHQTASGTKVFVPLNKKYSAGSSYPDYLSNLGSSSIMHNGKEYDFVSQIGLVAGNTERPIRKAVCKNGKAVAVKPLLAKDSPELVISKKVGSGKHKNILRCLGSVENPYMEGEFFLISEFAEHGTVADQILEIRQEFSNGTTDRKTTLLKMLKICRDMCLGVQQLHEAGYKHLDLSPNNFYASAANGKGKSKGKSDEIVVKLADFGTSMKKDALILHGRSDLINYMSPEMRTVWGHQGNRVKINKAEIYNSNKAALRAQGVAKAKDYEKAQNLVIEKFRSLDKGELDPVGIESDIYSLVASIWDMCLDRESIDEGGSFAPIGLNNQKSWLDEDAASSIKEVIRDGFETQPGDRPCAKMLAESFEKLIKATESR